MKAQTRPGGLHARERLGAWIDRTRPRLVRASRLIEARYPRSGPLLDVSKSSARWILDRARRVERGLVGFARGHSGAANDAARARLSAILAHPDAARLPLTREENDLPVHDTLVDAPLTIDDALEQAGRLRIINRRVQQKFYADKLVVVSCIEKSGSTTLEICVREMLTRTRGIPHDVGIQKSLRYGPFAYVPGLYPEVLLYALDGGVLRAVLWPTLHNLQLLQLWACKHLILFRHPADRLVGRYCDPTPREVAFADGRRFRGDPQYFISDIYAEGREMEEAFDELIGGGYLWNTLDWMANWLHFADRAKTKIVLYERMRSSQREYFEEIHQFLFDGPMSEALVESLDGYLSRYRRELQPGASADRRYPRGYSGEVGIARAYFSERNLRAYQETIDHFVAGHPHAKLLLEAYPDLRLGA